MTKDGRASAGSCYPRAYQKKPLAEELLFGKLSKGGVVHVRLRDGKLVLDIGGPDAKRITGNKPPLLTAD